MSQIPLISIITPCYNGEKYLKGYFEGILSQVHTSIELIFVNDGSTDATEKIAIEYGNLLIEKGMKFIYVFQENTGQAAAINKGLQIFSGDYLTWLDSDDIMLADNLSKKLAFLEENPDYGFALSGIQIVDERSPDIVNRTVRRKRPNGEDSLFEDLIRNRNVVWGPGTILVRRSCILEAFPSLHIYECREGQNWQLMLPLAFSYKCGYIDEDLLKCVSHSDSHSRQKRSMNDRLNREDNFITLCTETINSIPSISKEQNEKYNALVRITHNKEKLLITERYFNFGEYLRVKQLLKDDGYSLRLRDTFAISVIRRQWKRLRDYL